MTSAFEEAQEAGQARLNDAIQSYELALRLIEQWGAEISGEECAILAHHGETGDISWLLAWTEPGE